MDQKEVTGYKNANDFLQGLGNHHASIGTEPVSRVFSPDKCYVTPRDERDGKLYEAVERDGKIFAREIGDDRRREEIWEEIREHGIRTFSEAWRECERERAKRAVDAVVHYYVKEGGMEKHLRTNFPELFNK